MDNSKKIWKQDQCNASYECIAIVERKAIVEIFFKLS